MKISLLVLAFALTSVLSSPLARAAGEGANLDRFFHSLAGRWSGHGRAETVGYRFDLEVTQGADSTWSTLNTLTSDSGDYHQGSMNFQMVRGTFARAAKGSPDSSNGGSNGGPHDGFESAPDAALYISDRYSAWEPVALIETSPRSLTYSVERADQLTGRVYHAFFHLEIGATGDQLTGLNTIRQNGVVSWTEELSGQRF